MVVFSPFFYFYSRDIWIVVGAELAPVSLWKLESVLMSFVMLGTLVLSLGADSLISFCDSIASK